VAQPPPPPSAPWTASPQPPPPAWNAPTPGRRRRRLWIYLLVGAVVVIVGLAVASGTVWITKVKPPVDAANEYLRDITHGHYDAAFDQLCPAEKVDSSPQSLGRFARTLVFFSFSGYEVSPFDVHIDGSRATVKVDLNPDSRGNGDIVHLRLQKIGGEWRPCGGQFGFVRT
jgi:hypothetical protein